MDSDTQVEEGRSSRRGRLMGKLFGAKDNKDRKQTDNALNVNDFLHASADSLHPTTAPSAPPLPTLSKLDTRNASRYPQAHDVGGGSQNSLPLQIRPKTPPRAPKRNRKGCTVRFADTQPEVIGEGGDESPHPTIEISKQKKLRPPPSARAPSAYEEPPKPADPPPYDDFIPNPIKRTQTGYTSAREATASRQDDVPGVAARTRFLDTSNSRAKDENRRSFLEIQQAEMRQAEGKAFAEAARSAGTSQAQQQQHAQQRDWEDAIEIKQSPLDRLRSSPHPAALGPAPAAAPPQYSSARPISPETQYNTQYNKPPSQPDQSPSSVYSTLSGHGQQGNISRQQSVNSHYAGSTMGPPSSATNRQPSFNLQDAPTPLGDDALMIFVTRTRHLSELFRLHAETVRPVGACSTPELIRAALWWFLKGRMGLENAIRARPGSPKEQMQNEMERQQAYTNLAKAHWLSEEAIPEMMSNKRLPPDSEVDEARKLVVSALGKLAGSMKRNGFLPPEEAFLPQTIDKSIWVEYPKLSQDMIALLTGNSAAAMSGVLQTPTVREGLDALPINDTPDTFNFSRISVDAYLMEQGRESQSYHFKSLLSAVRARNQASLNLVLASQNGEVHLRISEDKNTGPTWNDVRWRSETCIIEIFLPRGFKIAVQCMQQDFRMIWNMYEFGNKTQDTLYPRQDEQCIFHATLRTFQFFDADAQSRSFPKEPVPSCDIALFEKYLKEKTPTGPRTFHRGYRLAVVSGPHTRTLSGINLPWTPQQPIPYGFLRGEGGDPALLLKCDNGRYKGSMVLSFKDEAERLNFHTLLTGTAVQNDETIYADVPLVGYTLSHSLDDSKGLPGISKLPWQSVRVINDDHGGDDMPPTVLSDKLRVIVDSKVGTIADRVNVETGELRVRLEVSDAKTLVVLRRPQNDVTMAVSDSQVGRESPKEMEQTLQMLQTTQSIRTFKFPSLKDLHAFQAALTGFQVKYDSLAVGFSITRRRMVVPVHKKWEAGWTRVQVVQQDTVPQLLAFFPDFKHGQCMNFVLKGTDVYETFSRSGKFGLRFVDAKFPLPRMPDDNEGPTDDMGFICLDFPDLPGEHDDVSFLFENEADRERLCQCLPAPVKGGSRLASKINF
ncbi:uncharacterized protein VDAG_04198 [Verticillium dahliae VdLs.17]|uniref:Uncharacterized protein n=1 Tax=Verticillium dahliae (strain VdLs.17 / ATCC MYA-4575 / FGSC 10137) TaxID=498257 RepID=G2X304_VERDV|nr:uncharacterized protein VDAG_04198 [Verticillium dahliae VdLs.17]EGY22760.1 hypothetical protein VDAG_04198 [Verticillium dahliae VdLs.17]KAF3346408.1 UPF0664 stress-induced protein C29B12.11c [Verticillium dahliae VDG2]